MFLVSFVIALVGMNSLIFFDTENQLLLCLFVLGSKFGVSCAFNLAYIGNNILFPVKILGTSYGVCNVFGRLATIFSPLVAELKPESISKWCFIGAGGIAILAISNIVTHPTPEKTILKSEKPVDLASANKFESTTEGS